MGMIKQIRLPYRIQKLAGTAPKLNGARDVYANVSVIKPFDDNGKPLFTYDVERYGRYTPTKEWSRDRIIEEHQEIMEDDIKYDGNSWEVNFKYYWKALRKDYLERAFRHIVYEIIGGKMFQISYKYYVYLFLGASDELFKHSCDNEIRVFWIDDEEYLLKIFNSKFYVSPMGDMYAEEREQLRERAERQKEDFRLQREREVQAIIEKNNKVKATITTTNWTPAPPVDWVSVEMEKQARIKRQNDLLEAERKRKEAEQKAEEERIKKAKEEEERQNRKSAQYDGYIAMESEFLKELNLDELNRRVRRFKSFRTKVSNKHSKIKNDEEATEMIEFLNKEIKRMNRRISIIKKALREQEEAERRRQEAAKAAADAAAKAAEEARQAEQQRIEEKKAAERRRQEFIKNSDPVCINSNLNAMIVSGNTWRHGWQIDDILKRVRFLDLPDGYRDVKPIHNKLIPNDYLCRLDPRNELLQWHGLDLLRFCDKDGKDIDYLTYFSDHWDRDKKAYIFHTRAEAFDTMLFFVTAMTLGQVDNHEVWIYRFIGTVFGRLNEARRFSNMDARLLFDTGETITVSRNVLGANPIYTWEFSFPLLRRNGEYASKLRKNMYGTDSERP